MGKRLDESFTVAGCGYQIGFDLEGVDELSQDMSEAFSYLSQDLQNAVIEAGDDAVRAMQSNHPYTDRTQYLTGGMYCRPFGRTTKTRAEAMVLFQAPYAKFVNDGVPGKSRPYPFLFIGKEAAEASLETRCSYALTVFCKRSGE